MTAVAVKSLVTDAIGKTVSTVTGTRRSRSAKPYPSARTRCPPLTTTALKPTIPCFRIVSWIAASSSPRSPPAADGPDPVVPHPASVASATVPAAAIASIFLIDPVSRFMPFLPLVAISNESKAAG